MTPLDARGAPVHGMLRVSFYLRDRPVFDVDPHTTFAVAGLTKRSDDFSHGRLLHVAGAALPHDV